MNTQASPRPELFLTWKEIYDRAETFWTKPLQEMLGTDTYVSATAQVRETILTQQAGTKEMLESHWETLRLPSKGDHVRLAGQVVALENKIDAVHDRLDGLEAKLDAILNKLAAAAEWTDGEEVEGAKRRRK